MAEHLLRMKTGNKVGKESVLNLKKELRKLQNPKQEENLSRFFKTGKGEYGEGDKFLGIKVPAQRKVAKKYTGLSFGEISRLLKSKIHEERLVGLLILVAQYKKSPVEPKEKEKIFRFYLKNTKGINNWDLVDLSAPNIVGGWLFDKPSKRAILYKLARSKNLWERRIAVLATAMFIKNSDFNDILKISEILLNDRHDLIHKAVGWMLREVGKRDKKILEKFLNKHALKMPRVMLRYSIEKFGERERKIYLRRMS
ncbi:MAG: DNA alkylation repair protein [Candidatus Pacebacteria bacterium]|nr:DNA alkylation repair protein [Candidatus Paceibacterota bacterium]